MNPDIRRLITSLVLVIAGMSAGWVIGSVKSYKEAAATVEVSRFSSSSDNLRKHVMLLRLLHDKKEQNVARELEAMVDGDLVVLSQYPPPLVPDDDQVIKSIRIAREYRDAYPTSNRSAEVSVAIKKAFDLAVALEKQ